MLERSVRTMIAPTLFGIASSDAHRVTGAMGSRGAVEGWAPGEDFILGRENSTIGAPRETSRSPTTIPAPKSFFR